MKRALSIIFVLSLVLHGAAYGAGKDTGLKVIPLEDEFAGQSAPLHTPLGSPQGGARTPSGEGAAGAVPGQAPGGLAPASGQGASGVPVVSGNKDALVVSYLIDMARKQNRPCPSGVTPPAPPSLMFSEPLCKAAEAVGGGAEPLAAMKARGLNIATWRMFSAGDISAQRVAAAMRQSQCEAMLEPHTLIGAYRGPSGWLILLATPESKKKQVENALPDEAGASDEAAPAVSGAAVSGAAVSGAAVSGAAGYGAAGYGAAARAAPSSEQAVAAGQAASGMSSREARALFALVNDLRVRGGSCLGKPPVTAPALALNPGLQDMADKEAGAAAAGNPEKVAAAGDRALYGGENITRLTLKANDQASVVLDVWMVNPSRCDALLSPMFSEAGAAYANGNWVLVLGGKGKGVPSPER